MTSETFTKIFKINMILILLIASIWAIDIAYKWYQVIHRPNIQLIKIDSSHKNNKIFIVFN